MSNKQQTAVELLEEKLKISFGNDMKPLRGFFVIAKEMEKKQIINANRDGVDMVVDKKDFISGEQYYEQTYGGNK
jgi:hypothetical protein